MATDMQRAVRLAWGMEKRVLRCTVGAEWYRLRRGMEVVKEARNALEYCASIGLKGSLVDMLISETDGLEAIVKAELEALDERRRALDHLLTMAHGNIIGYRISTQWGTEAIVTGIDQEGCYVLADRTTKPFTAYTKLDPCSVYLLAPPTTSPQQRTQVVGVSTVEEAFRVARQPS